MQGRRFNAKHDVLKGAVHVFILVVETFDCPLTLSRHVDLHHVCISTVRTTYERVVRCESIYAITSNCRRSLTTACAVLTLALTVARAQSQSLRFLR